MQEEKLKVWRWFGKIQAADATLATCMVCRRAIVYLFTALVLCSLSEVVTQPAMAALTCSISSTNLVFAHSGGKIDPLSTSNADVTATLTATCTSARTDRAMRMCVDISGGSAVDTTSRMMVNGAQRLRFQLYSDSGRSTAWGSWAQGIFGGGVTWDSTCTSSNCTVTKTVYGRVFGSQFTVVPGNYSSALTVSINYRDQADKPCPDPQNGSSSGNFTASAEVASTCQLTTTNLNFGTVGSLASSVDGTNAVSVTCSNSTGYNVGLGVGNGSGATVVARKMTKASTSDTVTYSLHRDSARSQSWGTTIGTDTESGTGSGSAQTHTVYGRVPAQSTPPTGLYTDTIIVTVTY